MEPPIVLEVAPGESTPYPLSFRNPVRAQREFSVVVVAEGPLKVTVDDPISTIKSKGPGTFVLSIAAAHDAPEGTYAVKARILQGGVLLENPGEVTISVEVRPRGAVTQLPDPVEDPEEEKPKPGGDLPDEDRTELDGNEMQPEEGLSTGDSKPEGGGEEEETPTHTIGDLPDPAKLPPKKQKPEPVIRDDPHGKVRETAKTQRAPSATPPTYSKPVVETLINPGRGTRIALKPGTRTLLHFHFVNDGPTSQKYRIRIEGLPSSDWLEIVQDNWLIPPLADGYVSCVVIVPDGAPAGPTKFKVIAGPVISQSKTSPEIDLYLWVLPLVAVKVLVPEKHIRVRARKEYGEVKLNVQNQGNVDTAYRLAVRVPEDHEGVRRFGLPTIYGSHWRYEFDKEIDNAPFRGGVRPIPHTLRVFPPRNLLGLPQSHRFTVVAVPVTDETNANLPDYFETLTGGRNGHWPVTLLCALFLFATLGGFLVSNLQITNTFVSKDEAVETFVLGAPDLVEEGTAREATVPVHLTWSGLPFLPTRVRVGDTDKIVFGTSADIEAKVPRLIYTHETVAHVGPPFGFGGSEVPVVLVPARTDGQLLVGGRKGELTSVKVGNLEHDVQPIDLTAGPDGAIPPIRIENASPDLTVHIRVAKKPRSYSIQPLRVGDEFALIGGAQTDLVFKRTQSETPDPIEEVVLLTTDRLSQVIRIRIRRNP